MMISCKIYIHINNNKSYKNFSACKNNDQQNKIILMLTNGLNGSLTCLLNDGY